MPSWWGAVRRADPGCRVRLGGSSKPVSKNRILRSREQYNAAVGTYNAELRKVRGVVVNKVTGKPFKERVFFQATAESQAAPKVSF